MKLITQAIGCYDAFSGAMPSVVRCPQTLQHALRQHTVTAVRFKRKVKRFAVRQPGG